MTERRKNAASGSRFAPRKLPRQERARATVENIMQATLELIEKGGFQSLSTTAIAERAGISVGSLYEYFPNREAVLLSLYETTSSRVANSAREVIREILDLPLEKGIPKSIEALLSIHGANKLILLDLVEEMPELKLADHPISYDTLMRGSISAYLQHIGVQLTPKELERRLFFIKHIIMGCIRQYLRNPPSRMSRRELIQDLSRIMISYLREFSRPEPGARSDQVTPT